MRNLIVAAPQWAILTVLLVFFGAVILGTRAFVLGRLDDRTREDLTEQAQNLFTGVAATFAFFVGFSINVTWGAVSAAQVAVEGQAAAIARMAWEIDNISDRAVAADLRERLGAYVRAAADSDDAFLIRGETSGLPSAPALDRLEESLDAYVDSPGAPERIVSTLISAAATLEGASAEVSAVASRAIPRPLVTLLGVVGVLACIVVGITTVSYRRPTLALLWCVIPAMSITVVLSLAYPFALRSGVTLAPLQAIARNLFPV